MDVSMFMFGIASLLESYSYEGSHEETKVQIGKLINRHKFMKSLHETTNWDSSILKSK